MEPHKPLFFDQEAAVDDLVTGAFRDKSKPINNLFKISIPSQNTPKPPQNAPKSGEKKNFHFLNFGVQKWEKVGLLRSSTASVEETTEYTEHTEMQGLAPPLHPAKAQGALPQLF